MPPACAACVCARGLYRPGLSALWVLGVAAGASVARAPHGGARVTLSPHWKRRPRAMPKKRSTPPLRRARGVRSGSPPPPWGVLLQHALRARAAGAWREVGRLLTLLDTARARPPTDPPSRVVQTWCTLQAHYWEHLAQDWQARARTAEEAAADIALVTAVAREALQTLVRRVLDALDAAGAPDPSVPEVCRELLKDLEAVAWGGPVGGGGRARAAPPAGVGGPDTPGAPPQGRPQP